MALRLSQFGTYSELSSLPNPEGYVLRSRESVRETLLDFTAVKGELLTKDEVKDAIDNSIVMATHPNEIDHFRLPHVFTPLTYDEYLAALKSEKS